MLYLLSIKKIWNLEIVFKYLESSDSTFEHPAIEKTAGYSTKRYTQRYRFEILSY